MSAREIIEEIRKLPLAEQVEVIDFTNRLNAERMLTAPELVALAKKMVAAEDTAEALEIREQLVRGFYGGASNA